MAVTTDYYELLGVSRHATAEELKKAYRRRARELHPDANPDDPDAEANFKELALAYAVLSDPEKRRRYDQFGPEGVEGMMGGDPFAGFGDLGDIFDAFFGGGSPFGGRGAQRGPTRRPRGADLEVTLEIDFEEAVFGTEKEVPVRTAVVCEECEGRGSAGDSGPAACPDCDGVGQVRQVRQTILGQVVTAGPCGRCGGTGEVIADPCPACGGDGRTIEDRSYLVDIPAGVDTGSTVRITGRGAVGRRGAAPGDLYVHLRVRNHDRFVRDGFDLHEELHIPMTQATLGAHVGYETLDGSEDLVVPPGTQTGRQFKLRGRGVPHVQGRGRGDLIVHVVVETPTDLSEDQEELLRHFAQLRAEEVAPSDQSFLGRIKSAFR